MIFVNLWKILVINLKNVINKINNSGELKKHNFYRK